MKRVMLSWSSGKDCAWTLHVLRQHADISVVGLVTTINAEFDRVAMHAVRRSLLEAQAGAARLPLEVVPLPWPCTNEVYESQMVDAFDRLRAAGVTHMAFGDLFLEDVRDYRIRQMAGSGIEPMFPLWGTADDTPELAQAMMAAGLTAVVTCVDPSQCPEAIAGRTWNQQLLRALPASVDPCGERGEFHTFCTDGPMFAHCIDVHPGEIVTRDGFRFADLTLAR